MAKKLLPLLTTLVLFLFVTAVALADRVLPTPVASTTTIVGTGKTIIGNPTPTPSSSPIPGNNFFYCQYGETDSNGVISKWHSWNGKCQISLNGCGPTSVATILTTFGDKITPDQVAETRNMGCNASSSYDQLQSTLYNWVKPKGYDVQQISVGSDHKIDTRVVNQFTSRGYLVIAAACMTVLGGAYDSALSPAPIGHEIVIKSVNPDNTLEVMDPTFCSSKLHGLRKLDPTINGKDVKTFISTDGCHFPGWGHAFAVRTKQNGL